MVYKQLYQRLVDRICKGAGESSIQLRQAAFDNKNMPEVMASLVNKVAYEAYKITDNDIAEVKAAGINEDQLFEIIICSAIGQASRQYKSGLAALAEATKDGDDYAA